MLCLIHTGRDCDVLVHEATMEDDLVDDAVKKKHRFLICFLSLLTLPFA